MVESEKNATEFSTFNEFFTRKLKLGMRRINTTKGVVVSPVDGEVSCFGKVKDNALIQAKGRYYTIEALLGDNEMAREFKNGSFITMYLHPRDYHRVHAPISGKITGFQYIPGTFFPVNGMSLNAVNSLFAKNERLVTYMETSAGKIAIVKIGATLVGRIRINYADFVACSSVKAPVKSEFSKKVPIKKGAELCMFGLGSTIVLLFPKGMVTFCGITECEKVKMGEKIATLLA